VAIPINDGTRVRASRKNCCPRCRGVLFLVAAFVLVTSSLAFLGHDEPRPSFVGIALLIVAAFGMPWLAREKRKLATQLSTASLNADATKSSLCGYLSWIALAGLLVNAVLRKSMPDPIAALILVPFIVKEGWEAIRASRPGCYCCSA